MEHLLTFKKHSLTVDYGILIRKLNHYGVKGTGNSWLHLYLENRTQFASIYPLMPDSNKKVTHTETHLHL